MNSVYQWCVGSSSGVAWEPVIIRLTEMQECWTAGGGGGSSTAGGIEPQRSIVPPGDLNHGAAFKFNHGERDIEPRRGGASADLVSQYEDQARQLFNPFRKALKHQSGR